MKTVIGITGESRAGKSTFIKHFSKFCKNSWQRISSGEILLNFANKGAIEPTRHNLQRLAVEMEKKFGAGTLSRLVQLKIFESDADVILYDSVRWFSDERMIRTFSGSFAGVEWRNSIVYITAEQEIRWQRALKANEKAGDDRKTFQAFLEEDQAPNEIYISSIGSRADFRISNNGTDDELFLKVKEFNDRFVAV